jgi:hypothetical protein
MKFIADGEQYELSTVINQTADTTSLQLIRSPSKVLLEASRENKTGRISIKPHANEISYAALKTFVEMIDNELLTEPQLVPHQVLDADKPLSQMTLEELMEEAVHFNQGDVRLSDGERHELLHLLKTKGDKEMRDGEQLELETVRLIKLGKGNVNVLIG